VGLGFVNEIRKCTATDKSDAEVAKLSTRVSPMIDHGQRYYLIIALVNA